MPNPPKPEKAEASPVQKVITHLRQTKPLWDQE